MNPVQLQPVPSDLIINIIRLPDDTINMPDMKSVKVFVKKWSWWSEVFAAHPKKPSDSSMTAARHPDFIHGDAYLFCVSTSSPIARPRPFNCLARPSGVFNRRSVDVLKGE
jgi:hypothetical protein